MVSPDHDMSCIENMTNVCLRIIFGHPDSDATISRWWVGALDVCQGIACIRYVR